jgi:hypothetical protein
MEKKEEWKPFFRNALDKKDRTRFDEEDMVAS